MEKLANQLYENLISFFECLVIKNFNIQQIRFFIF